MENERIGQQVNQVEQEEEITYHRIFYVGLFLLGILVGMFVLTGLLVYLG